MADYKRLDKIQYNTIVPDDVTFYEQLCNYLNEFDFVYTSEIYMATENFYHDNYCDEAEWLSYWEMCVLSDFTNKYIEDTNLVLDCN